MKGLHCIIKILLIKILYNKKIIIRKVYDIGKILFSSPGDIVAQNGIVIFLDLGYDTLLLDMFSCFNPFSHTNGETRVSKRSLCKVTTFQFSKGSIKTRVNPHDSSSFLINPMNSEWGLFAAPDYNNRPPDEGRASAGSIRDCEICGHLLLSVPRVVEGIINLYRPRCTVHIDQAWPAHNTRILTLEKSASR